MISKRLTRGIDFLTQAQLPNGSFPSLASPSRTDYTGAITCHSVFSTTLILSSLHGLGDAPSLSSIKRKAADFLLAQKSDHWTFNYWDRGSQQAKDMPYADDLDDTAGALAALTQYDPKLVDGTVLAKLATVLTTLEAEEGGPYRTWLVSENAEAIWRDVDLGVNSNIGFLLALHDVELPSVTALIETALDAGTSTSPYYPTSYPILYFVSRWYRGKATDATSSSACTR